MTMTAIAETPSPITPCHISPDELSHHPSNDAQSENSNPPPRYAFTPKPSNKNVKLPKAWERRPATPFKLKGTGKNHKIWKRVFQDENTIDAAFRSFGRQKENADTRKILKKIKLQDDEDDHAAKAVATLRDNWAGARERKAKAVPQLPRKRVGLVNNRQGALREDTAQKRRSSRLLNLSNEESETKPILEDVLVEAHSAVESKEAGLCEAPQAKGTEPERNEQSNESPHTSDIISNVSISNHTTQPEHSVISALEKNENTAEGSEDPIESTSVASPAISNRSAIAPCDRAEAGTINAEITIADASSAAAANGLLAQGETAAEDSDDTEVMSDADMEAVAFAAGANLMVPLSDVFPPNTELSTETTSVDSANNEQDQDSGDATPQSTGTRSPHSSLSLTKDDPENRDISAEVALPNTLTDSFIEPATEDDTEFLQGFLSRAKAKKEAKAASMSAPESAHVEMSLQPRTRSQRRHSADGQLPSTTRRQRILRPTLGCKDGSLVPEMTSETNPASPRRSSRPRVPKPSSKIAPVVPNNIPVRRPKGTEFVFLQKDETQKLALTTRRNTQRNKGESVHPSYRLLELNQPAEEAAGLERSRRSRSRSQSPQKRTKKSDKQVQWDNQLAYFQERKRNSSSTTSTWTKKVRRLGTPAAKRQMERSALGQELALDSSTLGPSGGQLRLRGD